MNIKLTIRDQHQTFDPSTHVPLSLNFDRGMLSQGVIFLLDTFRLKPGQTGLKNPWHLRCVWNLIGSELNVEIDIRYCDFYLNNISFQFMIILRDKIDLRVEDQPE